MDEAITGRDTRWNRLVWLRHDPHVVNDLGSLPLLLHNVKLHEKGPIGADADAATICDELDRGCIIGAVRVWALGVYGLGILILVLVLVLVLVLIVDSALSCYIRHPDR